MRTDSVPFSRHWPGTGIVILCMAMLGCDGTSEDTSLPLDGSTTEFAARFHLVDEVTLPEDSVLTVAPSFTVKDGTIWVADSRDAEVRSYSYDGRLTARFGTSGDGPGEFRQPVRALPFGDTLLVLEAVRRPSVWTRPAPGDPWIFSGEVATGDNARINDGRALPNNGLLLASYVDPRDAPRLNLGIRLFALDAESGEFEADVEGLGVASAIPGGLEIAYATSGWTVIDAGPSEIVTAVSLQDTVHLIRLGDRTSRRIPLPTVNFRQVEPASQEELSSRNAQLAWMESFSAISDLFLLSDDVLLVQYIDFVDREPRYRLLAMTLEGTPLYQILDTPRLVAWDPETSRMLGYRSLGSLPNELAWYTVDVGR